MGVSKAAHGVRGSACLALGQGATVEVDLQPVGGPVEPTHYPGLSMLEAGGGHGLEPVAEGVGVIVDGPEDMEDTEGVENVEDVERGGH